MLHFELCSDEKVTKLGILFKSNRIHSNWRQCDTARLVLPLADFKASGESGVERARDKSREKTRPENSPHIVTMLKYS